jgi:hypothetical protein
MDETNKRKMFISICETSTTIVPRKKSMQRSFKAVLRMTLGDVLLEILDVIVRLVALRTLVGKLSRGGSVAARVVHRRREIGVAVQTDLARIVARRRRRTTIGAAHAHKAGNGQHDDATQHSADNDAGNRAGCQLALFGRQCVTCSYLVAEQRRAAAAVERLEATARVLGVEAVFGRRVATAAVLVGHRLDVHRVFVALDDTARFDCPIDLQYETSGGD